MVVHGRRAAFLRLGNKESDTCCGCECSDDYNLADPMSGIGHISESH